MLCTHKTTILCQFGLIICHQLTNSYLNQFSTIFGGNCINITQCCLPPMLGFLIDEMSKYILSPGFLLLSSFFFGIFFCLIFSLMSNLGNYSLCLSSQPCNILLWHPSNDVQHVLSLCGSILLIVFHLQSLH